METMAMHIANGIVSGPVSAVFAVFAALALALVVAQGFPVAAGLFALLLALAAWVSTLIRVETRDRVLE